MMNQCRLLNDSIIISDFGCSNFGFINLGSQNVRKTANKRLQLKSPLPGEI
jgi:hypothetical protein